MTSEAAVDQCIIVETRVVGCKSGAARSRVRGGTLVAPPGGKPERRRARRSELQRPAAERAPDAAGWLGEGFHVPGERLPQRELPEVPGRRDVVEGAAPEGRRRPRRAAW